MNKDTIYYFIGIKGSGMSSLAMILHDQGCQVAGSDIDEYTFTQKPLAAANIPMYSFNAANIKPGMTVIRGNSFTDDQVEVAAALALGEAVTVVSYPDMVQALIQQYTSIGVAGAHGKTSTTGLLAHVLSGIAPTSFLIGDGTGKGVPDARFFVFEADEYRRHFAEYTPDYAILTNIDFDHPDYYTGIDDVFDAFEGFSQHVKKGIFAWGDDTQLRKLSVDVPIYYHEWLSFPAATNLNQFVQNRPPRSRPMSSTRRAYQTRVLGNYLRTHLCKTRQKLIRSLNA